MSNPLSEIASTLKRRLAFYRALLGDPRTPRRARLLLGAALGYLAMPFDLIPDWLPVVGHLDDALIVPGLIWLAMRSVPEAVYRDHGRLLKPEEEHTS